MNERSSASTAVLDRPPLGPDGQPPEQPPLDGQPQGAQPDLDLGAQLGVPELPGAQPASAEDQAVQTAEAQDVQARYTDAEILGRSYPVRRAVQEAGTQGIKAWQGLKAKIRNGLDTPGKMVKQFAYNRAKNSHIHKEARLQAATNERLRSRRQTAANQAKLRMEDRGASLKDRKERMEARTKAVHEHATTRRQEYIDELKGRRENALARKAVRQELRQDGASRREARAILAGLPAERLTQVGKVAIIAETSGRKHAASSVAMETAAKDRQKTAEGIGATRASLTEHAENIQAAALEAERLSANIPYAEARVSELRAALEGMNAEDPQYPELTQHLQLAERRVGLLNKHLDAAISAVKTSSSKVAKAAQKRNQLEQRYTGQGQDLLSASMQEAVRGHVNAVDQSQLKAAVAAALSEKEKEKEEDD